MIEPLHACARLDPPESKPQPPFNAPRFGRLDASRPSLFRHSGWAPTRQRIWDSFHRVDVSPSRAHDFRECGRYAYVLQSTEDPTLYRVAGSTCHDRFCVPCANSRSRTIALNVLDRLGKTECRFLTLTLQSTTESLSFLLDKLTTSFAALRRSVLWRKRVTGGVSFLELKWSSSKNRWNVHLHALLQGRYIPKNQLQSLWRKITLGSFVIDIRFVRDNDSVTQYVTKYASKPLDPSVTRNDDRLDEAVVALKRRRLATTFGAWRGVLLTPKPDEEAWNNIGTLSTVILSAEGGEPWAEIALAGLGVTFAPCQSKPTRARSPPAFLPVASQATFSFPGMTLPRSSDLAFD